MSSERRELTEFLLSGWTSSFLRLPILGGPCWLSDGLPTSPIERECRVVGEELDECRRRLGLRRFAVPEPGFGHDTCSLRMSLGKRILISLIFRSNA